MSDTLLRNRLIRLASEHPEFRKDLLPLIASASNGGFDPEEIGENKPGGSAEGDKGSDAAKPWAKGEFSQQENRELAEKQEKGLVSDGKADEAPQKVAQIKAVIKMAKTAREAGEKSYRVACSCGEQPKEALEVAKKAVTLWKKQNPA